MLAFAPAPAGSAPPAGFFSFDNGQGVRDCSAIWARVDDPLEEARAIRQAPDEASPAIGRLAAPGSGSGAGEGGSFGVTASFDGWLHVGDGEAAASDDAVRGEARPTGWMSGRGVSTGVRASQGYSHPHDSSQIVLRSTEDGRLDRHAELIDVIACDGAWILGRWRIDQPDKVAYRPEVEISTDPAVVEIWTMSCDRRDPMCDTPDRGRPRPAGPRDPFPRR